MPVSNSGSRGRPKVNEPVFHQPVSAGANAGSAGRATHFARKPKSVTNLLSG